MLEMITFWISYGVVTLFWWLGIVLLGIRIFDWWVEKVTGGDVKCCVGRYLKPVGTWIKGLPDDLDFLCFLVGLLIAVLSVFNIIITFKGKYSVHQITINISEFMSEHLTYPIIGVLLLLVLHQSLKKVYQLGKKVKTFVDKVDKEKDDTNGK